MKKVLLLLISILALGGITQAQSILVTEDFETVGGDYGYTLDPPNDCGCCAANDMWGSTTGDAGGLGACAGITVTPYLPGNISGSRFFAVEDLDDSNIQGPGGTFAPGGAFLLDSVSVAGYNDLNLRVLLATPLSSTTAPSGFSPAGQFESGDSVLFQYALDADIGTGSYTTFASLIPNGDNDLALDSDGDFVIDGPALDSALTSFDLSIPATGTDLRVRILFFADDRFEEIMMDRLQVMGCEAPTAPTGITAPAIHCNGTTSTLSIVGGALGDATDWTWYEGSCGGPVVGTGTSIDVSPTSTTTYFVEATGGCFGSSGVCVSETVTVSTADASFTIGATSSLTGCVPHFVWFEATGAGSVDWYWEFGNVFPSISTAEDPGFLFKKFGGQDVSLAVTNADGCVDTVEIAAYIDVLGSIPDFSGDVLSGCPPLEVNFTDASTSNASITSYAWTFGDGDGASTASPTHTYNDGASFDVSLTVFDTDGCSNTETKTEYITTDTIAPVVTACVSDRNAALDADCRYIMPDFSDSITVVDACPDLSFVQTPAAGTVLSGVGSVVSVKLVASDFGGLSDSCSFNITLVDESDPSVIWSAGDQTIGRDLSCTATVPDYTSDAVITDACDGAPSVVQSPAAGTSFSIDTVVVITITATDASGNFGSASFNLNVVDDMAPSVIAPADRTLALDAACELLVPDFSSEWTVTDNCDASPFVLQIPGAGATWSGTGVQIVQVFASDAAGNSTIETFNVTLIDDLSPSVTWTDGDQNISLDASCEVTVPDYTISASLTVADNCDASPSVVQSPAAGTVITAPGSVVVTITATDISGNDGATSFTLFAVDDTDPTVSFPAGDQTIDIVTDCEVSLPDFTTDAIISDFCDADLTVVQSPAAGTIISGAGTVTTVTITATDISGNMGSTDFDVTIRDISQPVVVAPADQELVTTDPLSCTVTVPDYTGMATITDNCDATPTVIQTPPAGSTFTGAGGSFMVTIYATDASGNTGADFFSVLVRDGADPVFTSTSGDFEVDLDEFCEYVTPDFSGLVTVVDACDSDVDLEQTPAPGTVFTAHGSVVPITFVATDDAGNFAMTFFNITLRDVTAPVIDPIADVSVDASIECSYEIEDFTGLAVINDACDVAPVVVQFPAPGTLVAGGTTEEIEIKTTDAAGNTSSTTFNLIVRDVTAPVFTDLEDQFEMADVNCSFVIDDYTDDFTVFDFCDAAPVVTQDPAPGTIVTASSPTVTVTLTATDASGNEADGVFTINVIDNIPPVIEPVVDQLAYLDAACQSYMPDFRSIVIATDNCSPESEITFLQAPAPGTMVSGIGSQTVMITARDYSGNASNVSFTVDFRDPLPPTVIAPVDLEIDLDATCTVVVGDYTSDAIVNDNCDASPVVTQDPAPGAILTGPGTFPIVISATDASGYTASNSFSVELRDVTAPVFTACVEDQLVDVDESCNSTLPDFTSLAVVEDCDGFVLFQDPAPGTAVIGFDTDVTVTITARDPSGNESTCSFTASNNDNTAPVVTPPTDRNEAVSASCKFSVPDYTGLVTVTDNCETDAIVQIPAPGTVMSGTGSIFSVSFSATDLAGNTGTASMTVTLIDTLGPNVTITEEFLAYADESCSGVLEDYTSGLLIADNCTDAADVFFAQSPPVGTVISDITTVLITVYDANGNHTTVSFDVNFVNEQPPVIADCPVDIDRATDATLCGAEVEWVVPTAFDVCGDPISIGSSHSPGDFFPVGTTTVQYAATNPDGVMATCAFDVRVSDEEAPVVECPDDVFITTDDLPYYYSFPYADNCDIADWTQVFGLGGGEYPLGTTTERVEVEDTYGNVTVCEFTITVEPKTTGIDPTNSDVTVTIYPNPTRDLLIVDVDGITVDGSMIRVFDVYGKTHQIALVGDAPLTLDLSTFSAGIYFLDIEGENFRHVERIVVVE